MGYSKGPLKVSGPSREGDFAIVESGGIIIGEAFHSVGEDAYRDAEANARLWAKAPDLLAALEELEHTLALLLPNVRNNHVEVSVNEDALRHKLQQARAAIAGAKGVENDPGL